MNYNRPLSHEETRGTKTYHFPLAAATNPRVTAVIRRDPNSGRYRAGFSICSLGDSFRRVEGRNRAFERMLYAGHHAQSAVEATPDEIVKRFGEIMNSVNSHRPGTITEEILFDLMEVAQNLDQAFDKLDANRAEKDAAAA